MDGSDKDGGELIMAAYHNTDRDPGEIEGYEPPANVWHPSHQMANPSNFQLGSCTEAGRAALAAIKSQIHPPREQHATPRPAVRGVGSSWRNAPEAFRRLVARAAGLSLDVVAKVDRELTESEKAAIRAAAARLKERAEGLFAI